MPLLGSHSLPEGLAQGSAGGHVHTLTPTKANTGPVGPTAGKHLIKSSQDFEFNKDLQNE